MEIIKIINGEERVNEAVNYTQGWLHRVVKDDEDRTEVLYDKPSFTCEVSPNTRANINYNYDGMLLSIKYDPETRLLKGQGYGWKECEFIVDK